MTMELKKEMNETDEEREARREIEDSILDMCLELMDLTTSHGFVLESEDYMICVASKEDIIAMLADKGLLIPEPETQTLQ